jgi:hypothetical protein
MKTSGPAVQIIPEANLDPRKIVIKSVDCSKTLKLELWIQEVDPITRCFPSRI